MFEGDLGDVGHEAGHPRKGILAVTLPKRFRIVTAVAALSIAAFVPASAHAGVLASSATNCDSQTLSQPFLPFADVAQYTLEPGGDFEPGSTAWALTGNAGPAAGNEPWNVTASSDSNSLSLGSGGSATSPAICVGIQHPDVRFFAKASSALAALRVEVLYLDGSGNTQSLAIGTITANTGWAPTAPLPIVANLLPLLSGSETPVQFRLTAVSGTWNVDDFYVDPFSRW